MAHRHTKGPKRGQCGSCPATKGLAQMEVAPGRKLVLCLECRQVLRRLQKESGRKLAAAAGAGSSGIQSAVDAGDDILAEDVDATIAEGGLDE